MDTVIFNVRCPHCGKALQSEVTGFCRTGLNSRHKTCKYCSKDYSVVFFAEANTDIEHTDGYIASVKSRLAYAKSKRVEEKLELENQLSKFHAS